MFKNYLKITFRNIVRHRGFSIINIFGLAMGMACTILILLWVRDEVSFDRFHEKKENIYRVIVEGKNSSEKGSLTPGLLAPFVKEEVPEVINAVRIRQRPRMVVRQGQNAFYEDRKFRADPSIFEIFSFPFIKGNPGTASSGIVITEKIARKYFGDENPIGKTLNINNWYDIEVTGVIKDIPHNSHLQFDFIVALEGLKRRWPGGFTWRNFVHHTYVQLEKNADPRIVEQKMTEMIFKHAPEVSQYMTRFCLQPLTHIHLTAGLHGENGLIGDKKYVFVFSIIAFFILFIACINFMNLTTARSLNRAKEVGIRKATGANRKELVKQFFSESFLLTFISLFIALILVELFLSPFNHLTGKHLAVIYSDYSILLSFIGVAFITGIIAGSYPALYLSSFKPVKVLKSTLAPGKKGDVFRKILVVTQFSLSIMLIISTTVIYNQLHYMRHMKLGFDKENIIYIPAKENIAKKYEIVKNQLLQNPNILGVTAKNSLPLDTVNHVIIDWQGRKPDQELNIEIAAVDFDFIHTLNLEIVEGRNFSRDHPSDPNEAVIVNEETVRQMGITSPIGKQVTIGTYKGRIVGVIKDANFRSLQYKIKPILMHLIYDWDSAIMNLYGAVFIRVRGGHIPEVISHIEKTWKSVNPLFPFEYHFLDETYDNLYNKEKRLSTIFNYFTFCAIFISCLGLFGLASYMVERRTREIGIRKVLGASVPGLVQFLSKEFTRWVLLANIIAWPAAYVFISRWIQNYVYRIDITPWIFILSGLLAWAIALFTVSYQAIRAASVNPVEVLRYE
jgi:putative ABC transport system permease protein